MENEKSKDYLQKYFDIEKQVDISILQSVEHQNSKSRESSAGECPRDPAWIPQICVSSRNPSLDFLRKLSYRAFLNPTFTNGIKLKTIFPRKFTIHFHFFCLSTIKYELMQNSYLERGKTISQVSLRLCSISHISFDFFVCKR